jgi:hypothetical protein
VFDQNIDSRATWIITSITSSVYVSNGKLCFRANNFFEYNILK